MNSPSSEARPLLRNDAINSTALARASSMYKRHPSPRQRGRSTKAEPKLSKSNKYLVVSPRWVLYSRTDGQTDRRS
jgi:hypothetical protein